MRNKMILCSAMLLISAGASAEQSLLQEAGKQEAQAAVTTAAPEAVKNVDAASQTVEQAKELKQSVENAPAAVKDQVKDAAKQKLEQATPEQIKQGKEALESGKETVKQLKGKVDAAPKSTGEAVKAAKGKAKQKAAEKALDMLR